MELTKKQKEGLQLALEKYKRGDKYITIAGYAGTGKSTLVKFIIDALGVPKDKVGYACFTGKAAEVLRKKGNDNALTLHKMLYDFHPQAKGGFYRIEKEFLEYKVVVVDEISMAPKSMLQTLLKHNVFCIFLGDPFQLPQISKSDTHDLLDNPHIFLDEVMRQAAESEIIQLTMKIREGKRIENMVGKEVQVLPKNQLNTGMLLWADQILVATNATRNSINNQVRELKGFSGLPQEGEKMICLKNYWEEMNPNGDALVNGMTGTVKNTFESFRKIPNFIPTSNRKLYTVMADFVPDGELEKNDIFRSIDMDKKMLLTEEKCVDWKLEYKLGQLQKKYGRIVPLEFAFGYAITCHKAQGSEWDKVLVIEENFPFDKKEHARWLYTACTRAAQKLVLIRK